MNFELLVGISNVDLRNKGRLCFVFSQYIVRPVEIIGTKILHHNLMRFLYVVFQQIILSFLEFFNIIRGLYLSEIALMLRKHEI